MGPERLSRNFGKIHYSLRNNPGERGSHLLRYGSLKPCVVNYGGADKSLVRPTSRCILFDGENISFDASLVIYI